MIFRKFRQLLPTAAPAAVTVATTIIYYYF